MKRYLIAILIFLLMIPALLGFSGYIYKVGDKISIGRYSDDFDGAVTAIGSSNYTLVIDKSITVTQDVTVPATMALEIGRDGYLTYQDANVDLTINGPVMAGPYQWIDPNRDWVDFGTSAVDKLYVQWWGVVGDNSTDNSSKLNNAIAAASDCNIPLFFPEGIYLGETITLASNVKLQGSGKYSSIIKTVSTASAGDSLLLGNNVSNVIINDLGFNGNEGVVAGDPNTGVNLIYLYGTSSYISIKNCYIYNNGYCGIKIAGTANNIFIEDNIISDTDCGVITQSTGAHDIYISRNRIDGGTSEGISFWCSAGNTEYNLHATGNHISDKVGGVQTRYSEDFVITNNVIEDCSVGIKGYWTSDPNTISKRGIISDNCITSGFTHGIWGEFDSCIISSNRIHEMNSCGIWLDGNTAAVAPSNNIIENNIITDINGSNNDSVCIRLSDSDNNIVSGNYCHDTRDTPLNYNGIQVRNIKATSDNNIVIGNYVTDTTNNDYYINGIGTFFANNFGGGYVNEQMGSGNDFSIFTNGGGFGFNIINPTSTVQIRGALSSALAGTVSVTQSDANVVGSGTSFQTYLSVGDSVKILTEKFTVSSIADQTHLVLDSAYAGSTASGLTIYRDPPLFVIENGDAVNKLMVDKSGNVGIGTSTPDEKFEVEWSANVDVEIGRGTTDDDITFIALRNASGTKCYLYPDPNGNVLTVSTTKP